MQQFGVANVWQQGDFITRFLLFFLLAMSVLSWAIMLIKGVDNRRIHKMGKICRERFWSEQSIDAGIEALSGRTDNPYRKLALAGREAYEQQFGHQSALQGDLGKGEWISRCLRNQFDDEAARLQNGLTVIASIGSTAPFVGLFGTVWGIYHALMAIGASGQASLDHVAGPVGESLIMTAIGLFVAIPAVLGYNAVNRGNRKTMRAMSRFVHELHVYFMMDGRSGVRSKEAEKRTNNAAG